MRFFISPTQGSGFMLVICDRQLVDQVCNQPKGYKATKFYAQANAHPKDYERRRRRKNGMGKDMTERDYQQKKGVNEKGEMREKLNCILDK